MEPHPAHRVHADAVPLVLQEAGLEDLIQDEGEDVPDGEEVPRLYRARPPDQELDPEKLEAFIRDRFESRAYGAALEDSAQAGAGL